MGDTTSKGLGGIRGSRYFGPVLDKFTLFGLNCWTKDQKL
jgi:hypothetical protein